MKYCYFTVINCNLSIAKTNTYMNTADYEFLYNCSIMGDLLKFLNTSFYEIMILIVATTAKKVL